MRVRAGKRSNGVFRSPYTRGFSDLLIGELSQLLAASAHLNGDIPQRRAAKIQPGCLLVIRASNVVELVQGPPLEFLDGLARGPSGNPCDGSSNPSNGSSNPSNKHGHESILA